jgi:hypothetical protein
VFCFCITLARHSLTCFLCSPAAPAAPASSSANNELADTQQVAENGLLSHLDCLQSVHICDDIVYQILSLADFKSQAQLSLTNNRNNQMAFYRWSMPKRHDFIFLDTEKTLCWVLGSYHCAHLPNNAITLPPNAFLLPQSVSIEYKVSEKLPVSLIIMFLTNIRELGIHLRSFTLDGRENKTLMDHMHQGNVGINPQSVLRYNGADEDGELLSPAEWINTKCLTPALLHCLEKMSDYLQEFKLIRVGIPKSILRRLLSYQRFPNVQVARSGLFAAPDTTCLTLEGLLQQSDVKGVDGPVQLAIIDDIAAMLPKLAQIRHLGLSYNANMSKRIIDSAMGLPDLQSLSLRHTSATMFSIFRMPPTATYCSPSIWTSQVHLL